MRWVTAVHLEQWANTLSSRTELSEVISDLIRATASTISSFRFPTGDSAQVPGYDGRLVAEAVPPYIPGDGSVWEFGTSQDYAAKANDDYKARTANPGAVNPRETAFVVVTGRQWKRRDISIDQWVAEKSAEKRWREVRVIDAIALEDWLERQPAVALRLARSIGLAPAEGVQSTDQFWDEYASRFDPAITEKVLLAGREDQAQVLVAKLRDQPFRQIWQADSPEEVIAFAVAAIRASEPEVRKYLEARTVVVSTEEAARNLATRSNLVFLPRSGASKLDAYLGQKNATIVAIGRDAPSRQGAVVLQRPTSDQLIEALKTTALSEQRALQLGRTCGRSVTILARRIPSGTAPRPEWEKRNELIPALLAGGWHAQRDEDKQLVAQLAGVADYFEYEDRLRGFLRMQDPALEREGDVWRVRAPVDAFVHLGSILGRADLERLRVAANTVFSQPNPVLDLPVDERQYAGLTGQRQLYSEWLRAGIATSLLLLSALHDQLGISISGLNPEQFVNEIVAALPNFETDYRTIASLHGELTLLMEASPRPLLTALERLLEGDGLRAVGMFQDQEDTMFGSSSPHTAVLWSLEMISWDPMYIRRSALVLAKLAKIDPGGKLANRPINSLREILLPWHPNTYATEELRMGVIDAIISAEPDIGWELLLKLLPEYSSIGSNTPKPRFRDVGGSEKEILTRGLVARTYNSIISRTIEVAGKRADRWRVLVGKLASFAPVERLRAIVSLESFVDGLSDEEKLAIWTDLKAEVNRHETFQSTDWSMKGADLNRLQSLVNRLQPGDLVEQIAWLFDKHLPHVPNLSGTARYEAIEEYRREAIARLISTEGDTAVLRLARRAKVLQVLVGPAVAAIGEASRVAALLDEAFRTATTSHVISLLSAQARFQFRDAWSSTVATGLNTGRWSRDQIIALVLFWPDERDTWEFVRSLGSEVEGRYWKESPIQWVTGTSQDFDFAARKLWSVGRPLAAIRAIHHSAEHLSTAVIFELLDRAVVELNANPSHASTNLPYEIDSLFESLRKRTDVSPAEVAGREYAYLPMFGYLEKKLTIHTLLAEDPSLFVSILADVFKPESGENREPTDESVTRAKIGFRLLSEFTAVPGSTEQGFDPAILAKWIEEVRRIAKENDRARMADEYVGKVLAHTPPDSEGMWPDVRVAKLIETLASEKVEQGVSIEQFNMRGVTIRGPFDGGDQERGMVSRIRQWANSRKLYPRTFSLLSHMADYWQSEAEREDQRAKQDAMRFE